MPTVMASDGTLLHVEDDAGAGTPVVLLAGWGFSGAVWDAQASMLNRTHRVVRIDLRGHGRSAAPAVGYGIDRLAADVGDVLDALDLRQVTLVGWSFGGLVATRVAANSPARVARLMLVGSCGVATGRHERFPFGNDAAATRDALISVETAGGPGGRRATIAQGFATPPTEATLDALAADASAAASHAGVACLRTLFDTDQVDLIGTLRVLPTLIVVGDRDRICPLDGARWVCDRLENAALLALPECGHYPMFEAPSAFDAALRDFAG